jgi:hypothetical protein
MFIRVWPPRLTHGWAAFSETGVPQVMIDNPRLTKEDMAWAKKILELEKKKD